MLSDENLKQFSAAFSGRIQSGNEDDDCACLVFPEVTENEQVAPLVQFCLDRIVEKFYSGADEIALGESVKHALVVALAYGMSYGSLSAIGNDDSDDFSWDLSDEQLSKLAEGDFLGD